MTLIVAKKIGVHIQINSDAKKTDLSNVLRGIECSILKTVIINKNLCVSFAGRIGQALSAIEQIYKNNLSFDEVKALLLQENKNGNDETDFIIGNLDPISSLTKISGGYILENLDQCWIGNKQAYESYAHSFCKWLQSFVGTKDEAEADVAAIVCSMHFAFNDLVASQTHSDVGQFVIEVANSSNEFAYTPQSIAHPGSLDIDPSAVADLQEYFRAKGSYGYSIIPPESPGIGAIGVYFSQASLGILLYPGKCEKPKIYRDVNNQKFMDSVLTDYGFRLKDLDQDSE